MVAATVAAAAAAAAAVVLVVVVVVIEVSSASLRIITLRYIVQTDNYTQLSKMTKCMKTELRKCETKINSFIIHKLICYSYYMKQDSK